MNFPDHHFLSRRSVLAQTAISTLALSPLFSLADAWPTKPLRLVVPFAPGGSSEIVARALAGEMAKTIGQNVFVDNKPGGAGNIAMQEVASSSDEHTLILGHIGTLAVNPYIFPKLPYDPAKDFTPITNYAFRWSDDGGQTWTDVPLRDPSTATTETVITPGGSVTTVSAMPCSE